MDICSRTEKVFICLIVCITNTSCTHMCTYTVTNIQQQQCSAANASKSHPTKWALQVPKPSSGPREQQVCLCPAYQAQNVGPTPHYESWDCCSTHSKHDNGAQVLEEVALSAETSAVGHVTGGWTQTWWYNSVWQAATTAAHRVTGSGSGESDMHHMEIVLTDRMGCMTGIKCGAVT